MQQQAAHTISLLAIIEPHLSQTLSNRFSEVEVLFFHIQGRRKQFNATGFLDCLLMWLLLFLYLHISKCYMQLKIYVDWKKKKKRKEAST
jgi:hypothetical protein